MVFRGHQYLFCSTYFSTRDEIERRMLATTDVVMVLHSPFVAGGRIKEVVVAEAEDCTT